MTTRHCIALLLAGTSLVAQAPGPPAAFQLPRVSEAQHWDRVSMHFLIMFNAFLAREREQGGGAEEATAFFIKLVGDEWPKEMGPRDMLVAMYRNFTMIPGTKFEVIEATESRVKFRVNRSYSIYYGKEKAIFGVPMEDYEHGLLRFHQILAELRDMSCEALLAGDDLVWTIQRKAVPK